MNRPVEHTLEQFAAACHDILKAENNPTGRSKVCALRELSRRAVRTIQRELIDAETAVPVVVAAGLAAGDDVETARASKFS